jgi:hypothetical protein
VANMLTDSCQRVTCVLVAAALAGMPTSVKHRCERAAAADLSNGGDWESKACLYTGPMSSRCSGPGGAHVEVRPRDHMQSHDHKQQPSHRRVTATVDQIRSPAANSSLSRLAPQVEH